jgi:DinB superfamily
MAAIDSSMIDQFERGGEKLRQAVVGLTREDLAAFPVPGTWSIQQIVIHLMDSELVGIDRMKRVAAEDNPLLIGYDETKFSQRLFYDQQSVESALTMIDLSRREFAKVLRKLPAEAFARTGVHNEVGKVTLGELVKKYVHHLDHHLKFIVEKRAKLGKAL